MTDEFTNALTQEGRDLGAFTTSRRYRLPLFREEETERILAILQRRRSVLLVGPEGAGKTAVVYGVAHALKQQGGRAIREFSTIQLLAGTKYIGEWQTKLTSIVRAAKKSKTSLYITDSWNLPDVGKTSSSTDNLWDALRPFLDKGEVQLVGEITPALLEKVQRAPGFSGLFEIVRIKPLEPEQIREVVAEGAKRMALELDGPSCARVLELCERFLPASHGPGPALLLLEQAQDYGREKDELGEPADISPAFFEKVFSIYSGLPLFVVSRSKVRPMAEIRDWFRERIIGQEAAIDAIVEMIALFKAGLHDPQRPIGTFLFVGPTGVGKTELARALATFLFGSPRRMLRFDLSEFKDYHAFEMLVGDPDRPDSPARLVDPVRTNPFQVILLDELEKAHQNVWDLLLQLLDEGRLTPPKGEPVNFRNTIVIATSNVGAREAASRSIGFANVEGADDARAKMQAALESTFRPEFLNRFQHLAFFQALTREQVTRIARQEIKGVLTREGISARNLVVDVADQALAKIIDDGFDARYGARALKRQIQRSVTVPIATLLMERNPPPGSILKVHLHHDRIGIRVLETPESRAHKKEIEATKVQRAKRYSRDQIRERAEKLTSVVEALAQQAGEAQLREDLQRMEEIRYEPGFWDDVGRASGVVHESEYVSRTLGRIEGLREQLDNLNAALENAAGQFDFERLSREVSWLETAVARAWRELLRMGRDGEWDAIVEIMPLGPAGAGPSLPARQLLFDTYRKWATGRGMRIEMLHEPMSDEEPVTFGVRGDFAYGLLRLEAGHHRLREGETSSVARVRIAPWTDRASEIEFLSHRALKKTGQFGGRVRSRLEVAGMNLVLQNDKTLAENRELAADVAPSWALAPPAKDQVVRRYDLKPFLMRDYLTGTTSGRADALKPKHFHELLCQRVDEEASQERERIE